VFVKCASEAMGKCSAVLLKAAWRQKLGEKNFAQEANWCGKGYSAAEIHVGLQQGARAAVAVSPAASIEDTHNAL